MSAMQIPAACHEVNFSFDQGGCVLFKVGPAKINVGALLFTFKTNPTGGSPKKRHTQDIKEYAVFTILPTSNSRNLPCRKGQRQPNIPTVSSAPIHGASRQGVLPQDLTEQVSIQGICFTVRNHV